MALWAKVQTLKQESLSQITALYSEDIFPIEVRNIFAEKIEDAVGGYNRLQDEKSIGDFFYDLIDQIQRRSLDQSTGDFFFVRRRLENAANNFKEKYARNPVEFFNLLKLFLGKEQSLIAEEDSDNQTCKDELFVQIGALKKEVSVIGSTRKEIDSDQECLNLHVENLKMIGIEHQKQLSVNGADIKHLEQKKCNTESIIQNFIISISQSMRLVENKLNELTNMLVEVQRTIISDRIGAWKTEQRQARNGFPMSLDLSSLQRLCAEFIEILWNSRGHIIEAQVVRSRFTVMMKQDPKYDLQLTQLSANLATSTNLIQEFLNKSFIVDKQPPQVLKLNNKLPVISVCLLVGKKLNIDMGNPQATVVITKEDSVRSSDIRKRGELMNSSAKFENHKDTNTFSALFKNMALTKIQRMEKKSEKCDSVMEEKFCLYFECVMTVGDMQMKISTISEALVVISHGSQEPVALATVMWDSAFAEPNRIPFDVPSFVTWSQLITVINAKIFSLTGRGLTEENIECLKHKAFHEQSQSEVITFTDLCKTNMPGRSFTFWDWIFNAVRVIEKFCKEPWKESYVMGFIEKSQADALLANYSPGTFLLRFSDSSLGAISVVCVHTDGKRYHVKPYEYNELKTQGLADKIMDLESNIWVYPAVPKETAFGKHVKPATNGNTTDGIHAHQYVNPKTTLLLPNGSNSLNNCTQQLPSATMSPFSDRYEFLNNLDNFPTNEMNNLTFDDNSVPMQDEVAGGSMIDQLSINLLMKDFLETNNIEPTDEPMEEISHF